MLCHLGRSFKIQQRSLCRPRGVNIVFVFHPYVYYCVRRMLFDKSLTENRYNGGGCARVYDSYDEVNVEIILVLQIS